MPRFRLLAPIAATWKRNLQLIPAGTEVDTIDLLPGWTPGPLVEPLDPEATSMLQAECDRLYVAGEEQAICSNGITLPGFGSTQALPLPPSLPAPHRR